MKNPLNKRLLRELRSECGKYLVIFILMTLTIGFVSGFLVADGSMIISYNESFEKYNIEDGNFRTSEKINKAQRKAVEEMGISLYDNYYAEETLTNGSTLRVFKNRQEVNKVCLMEGKMPEKTGEIAIDRMYAENNKVQIGDTLDGDLHSFQVTGLVALSDYSALFSDNNDSMFDSVKFGVSVVTEEQFADYEEEELNYCYSWIYDREPADEAEEKELSGDFMEELSGEVPLEKFIPRYANQAIKFTGDDMGGDKAMITTLLYIIMVIMAFVFGVTTVNTISKEASVIGTLRASGYTRGELIWHYMTMPVFVTLIGAVVGNILGYTKGKDICADMYYGSYSLPTYVTVWSGEAFILTTVVPVFLMLVINYTVLCRKLKLSPLKFLRRDLTRKKQKRAVPLSPRMGFFHRFRLRVIFQNISNYVVLFAGIIFANMLLMFGLLLPSVLKHYQEDIKENMLCNYQYMLQIPVSAVSSDSELEKIISVMTFASAVETENEDAEKFSAYSLSPPEDTKYISEDIILYGVQDDSRYIDIDTKKEGVYVSSAYASKYGLEPGDTITLREKYEKKNYTFQVADIFQYEGALTVYMPREELNRTFDFDEDYFSGYFSDSEITDIDEKYIASVIDLDALTKLSRQLDVSMGSMMGLVNGFAILIFIVLIYLLSKIIIEKNAQSISLAKILGYTNGEISRLYIAATSIMVVLFVLLSLPIERELMHLMFKEVLFTKMTGWLTFYVDPKVYIQMFLMGIVTYAAVAALEYRRIRKTPMDEALKNVE